MSPGARIEYKVLREINPEAARQAVLEYLKSNGGNKADAARVFGINRSVVYDILKKASEDDLRDRPKAADDLPAKLGDHEAQLILVKQILHFALNDTRIVGGAALDAVGLSVLVCGGNDSGDSR